MASRTSTDPIEILLEMGVDLDNLSEEEDYLSALMEAIAIIEFQTKGKGNKRSAALREEVIKVRKKRRAANTRFQAKKTTVPKSRLIGTSNIVPKKTQVKKEPLLALPPAAEEEKEKKKGKKQQPKNLLAEIAKSVANIADTLKKQYNLKKKEGEFDRKKAERDRRKLQENALEKRFNTLAKTAQKIIAPVKSIFDRIFNFITTILLGKFLMKLVDWISNPENQSKIKNIIRFLGDHWPKLLSLYLVFGTGLGRFILGFTKLLIRGAVQLGIAVAKLAAAKGVGGARKLARMLGGKKAKFLIGATSTALTVGSTMYGVNALAGGGEKQQTQGFAGGGLAAPKSPKINSPMGGGLKSIGSLFGPLGMLAGAGMGGLFGGNKKGDTVKLSKPASVELEVPSETAGEVDGPGGTDKVPAMLTAGEFVMSRGAVQKYGVKQLEAMNAAGGGTNKPKVVDNKVLASVGGYVDVPGTKFDTRTGTPLASKLTDPSFYRRALGEAGKFLPKIPSFDTGYAGRVGGEVQKIVKETVNQTLGGVTSAINNIKSQDYAGMFEQAKGMYGAAEEAVPALLGGIFGMNRVDRHISKDMQRAMLEAKANAAKAGRNYIDYKDYSLTPGGDAAALTMGRVADQEFKRDAQGRIIGLTQTFDTNRPAEEALLQSQISATRFLGMNNTQAVNKLNALVKERLQAEGASAEEIKKAMVKSGGDAGNIKDFTRAIYKPFEGLLDAVQGRGTTTHDVLFDKDVLGFDPVEAPPKPGSPNYQLFVDGGGMAALAKGKTVGQVVDAGRSANSTNPIMDFLGLSKSKSKLSEGVDKNITSAPGGIGPVLSQGQLDQRKMQNAQAYAASKGKYYSSTTGKTYASYSEALKDPAVKAASAKIAPTPPNVSTPAPPSSSSNVTVVKTGGGSSKSTPPASGGGSSTPNINAGSGDKGKFKIFGMTWPF